MKDKLSRLECNQESAMQSLDQLSRVRRDSNLWKRTLQNNLSHFLCIIIKIMICMNFLFLNCRLFKRCAILLLSLLLNTIVISPRFFRLALIALLKEGYEQCVVSYLCVIYALS